MHLGINGRVAVATGGNSGTRLSAKEFLLRDGRRVVPTDPPGQDLDRAGATLETSGDAAAAVVPAELLRPGGAERAAGIAGPTGANVST